MSPTVLTGVQFTFSLVLFALVANWYITPALSRLPVHSALVPLFLVHALRYLPSSAFAPGQIDAKVPADAMAVIAYGDLASAALALIAALFLYYRLSGAIGVAWIVNLVTSVDWLTAGFVAASNRLVTYPMGGNWHIINYYVPVIGVVHVMIFARLLRQRPSPPEPTVGVSTKGNRCVPVAYEAEGTKSQVEGGWSVSHTSQFLVLLRGRTRLSIIARSPPPFPSIVSGGRSCADVPSSRFCLPWPAV